MTVAWLAASGLTVLVATSVTWGGWRLRNRLLPLWHGAQARLAEVILALAIVIGTSQALGAVGLFRRLPFVVSVLAVAGVAARIGTSGVARSDLVRQPFAGPAGRVGAVAAIAAVAAVAGQWATFAAESTRTGVLAADSIWYHLPRAARFVQTGWLTRLHFTAPEFPDTFHPSNGELVHAVPMLLYGRDLLSPVVNLGWLALVLLAAWCVGRPFGLGPVSTVGVAALLASPLFVVEGAGNAGNDFAAAFFLLGAVAVLLQRDRTVAAIAVAGVSAGLAMSTKYTVVVPVVVLSLGVAWAAPRPDRAKHVLAFLAPLLAFGSYWYIRNLILVGSPVPAARLPLFPSGSFRIADELGFSVADYATDGTVWRDWFLPGLRFDFGWTWPLIFVLLIVVVAASLATRRDRLVQSVGAALVAAAAAYVVLPTTALGEQGRPVLFAGNVVYLAPALLLGFAVLPVLPPLRVGRRPLLLVGAFALVLAAGTTSPIATWAGEWTGLGVVVGVVCAAIGAWVVVGRPAARVTGVVGAVALVIVVLGSSIASSRSASHRYDGHAFYQWANELEDEDIAIAGFAGQLPFYGVEIDNVVQYVGDEGSHGEFHDVQTCAQWRAALRRGGYSYVVLRTERSEVAAHVRWTQDDPAATPFLQAEGGSVFRFDPSVADPGCD